MNTQSAIDVGDKITFKGFTQDAEDNPPLVEGEEYTVEAVNEDEDGAYYTVHIEDEGEIVAVDIYNDEIVLPGEEGLGDEIEFADVVKGDELRVSDVGGNTYEGVVFKKTKTLLGIRHDGVEITVRAKDITKINPVEEGVTMVTKSEAVKEEQGELDLDQEEAPAPKKKATAKKKTVAKKKVAAKSKATTKKKATAKRKTLAKPETQDEDEDLKGLIILDRDEEDKDILELVEGTDDILGLAQEMAEEAANMEYQLGGILYHVRVSKKFKELNKEYAERGGFAKYTEKELGIHYRKCMYLIDIYSVWNKYGLDKQWISDHGWSKALIVAKHVDDKNADDLMAVAEEQSVADLRETIKESYSKKGSDTREIVKKVTFKFRLMEEPASMITDYLEMAMKQGGYTKPEEAFEAIITEWAQEHLDVSKTRRRGRKAAEVAPEEKAEEKAEAKATAKPRARKKKAARQRAAA